MKIFVISLKTSIDRRNSVSRQLKKLNLDFEFIDAVNGSQMTDEEVQKNCDATALEKNRQWLSRGAIGCALSHKIAYDKIISQNISCALILEDDMILPDDLADIIENIPGKIQFGEVISIYYRSKIEISFSDHAPRQLTDKYKIYLPLDKGNIPGSACGYFITAETCKSLVKLIMPIHVASDTWKYFIEHNGIKKISIVYPRPLKDANFKSDIDYVLAYNSRLTAWLFKMINKFKVPVLYGMLKNRRAKRELEMSRFKFVSSPSIFE